MKVVAGYILIAIAVIIAVSTFGPIAKEEVVYKYRQVTNSNQVQVITPVDTDYTLVIPKLAINVKVVKEVDPYDPKIYQRALLKGVAHAKGTSLPGEEGNIFIFSHSSENFFEALRYNSIFYLLSKLNVGDEINIYYENNKHSYQVYDKEIVNPEDISYLKNATKEKTLTLMTCYPPGANFQRLVILAQEISL